MSSTTVATAKSRVQLAHDLMVKLSEIEDEMDRLTAEQEKQRHDQLESEKLKIRQALDRLGASPGRGPEIC